MLGAIQWPLWFGQGGWLDVWRLDRELENRVKRNDVEAQLNAALAAEVRDLAEGRIAVEERARYDLGMIGEDEIFIQINLPQAKSSQQRTTQTLRAAK
jgi:cell division protein FtsB